MNKHRVWARNDDQPSRSTGGRSRAWGSIGKAPATFARAAGCLLLGAAACSSEDAASSDAVAPATASAGQPLVDGGAATPADRIADDVILVHGAFADGSSWSGVIEHLQSAGFGVQAVQLPEQSLAADVALVRHAIESVPRPVIVAGHSYGGSVISEASAGAANVAGLVFVAAFAPDQGESINSLAAAFPPQPALANLIIDDQGNATVGEHDFVTYFASDLPFAQAKVAVAVQHPIAASIFGTPSGAPGWRTIPCFYQVSTHDQAIAPDLERFFAMRTGAETIELGSSHLSLVSLPQEIAGLIARAAAAK
jgi:pimeloyl-ACP methyl ester carboxylesterase